jgi:excisionase family DNA binding protein
MKRVDQGEKGTMKPLLTPEAAAEKLAVSVKTVKNLLRSGKLRGVKVGNLWRLQEEALEEYLKEPIRSTKPLTLNGETTVVRPESALKFRTSLGRRLWEIRSRLIASGEPLLGWEELEREIAERRGEAE